MLAALSASPCIAYEEAREELFWKAERPGPRPRRDDMVVILMGCRTH